MFAVGVILVEDDRGRFAVIVRKRAITNGRPNYILWLITISVSLGMAQSRAAGILPAPSIFENCFTLATEAETLSCLQAIRDRLTNSILHNLDEQKSRAILLHRRLQIDREQEEWERKTLQVCSRDNGTNPASLLGQVGYLQCELTRQTAREHALRTWRRR